MIPFPNKKYSIIYADPPWDGLGYNKGKLGPSGSRAPANHYSLMTADSLLNLPVQSLTAKNCALILWATYPNLPLATRVVETWGFRYATVAFTWVKTTVKGKWLFGCGNYTRANPEIALLGIRGSMKRVSASIPNLVILPATRHSEKPHAVRGKIVELFGDLPRIELFARQQIEGWDAWGNEV